MLTKRLVNTHKLVILLLVIAAGAIAGECPARELKPGEALDFNCKLFRVVKEGTERYIEKPTARGKQEPFPWRRVEKIDCANAKSDEFGIRVYYAKTVLAEFYCPKEEKK